LTEKAWIVY